MYPHSNLTIRVEMGVRLGFYNPVGRLKDSRGATDRTISVVDLFKDGSLDQIGHTSNANTGTFRFRWSLRLMKQRRVISPFDLSSDKATRRI